MTDTLDIVGRLRALKWMVHCEMRGLIEDPTAHEAADHIETLQARVTALEGALEFYAGHLSFPRNAWVQPTKVDYSMGGDGHWPDGPPIPSSELLADQGKLARQALGDKT